MQGDKTRDWISRDLKLRFTRYTRSLEEITEVLKVVIPFCSEIIVLLLVTYFLS
jgi:hypothetical protein